VQAQSKPINCGQPVGVDAPTDDATAQSSSPVAVEREPRRSGLPFHFRRSSPTFAVSQPIGTIIRHARVPSWRT
jgi:hypothetical protein